MGLLVDLGHDMPRPLNRMGPLRDSCAARPWHPHQTTPGCKMEINSPICEEKSKEIDFHIYFQSPLTKQFCWFEMTPKYVDFQEWNKRLHFYSTAVMVFSGLGDVRSSTMERLQREYGNESMTQAACRCHCLFGMKWTVIDQCSYMILYYIRCLSHQVDGHEYHEFWIFEDDIPHVWEKDVNVW